MTSQKVKIGQICPLKFQLRFCEGKFDLILGLIFFLKGREANREPCAPRSIKNKNVYFLIFFENPKKNKSKIFFEILIFFQDGMFAACKKKPKKQNMPQ